MRRRSYGSRDTNSTNQLKATDQSIDILELILDGTSAK